MRFDALNFFGAGIPAGVQGFAGARRERRQQAADEEFMNRQEQTMAADRQQTRSMFDSYMRALLQMKGLSPEMISMVDPEAAVTYSAGQTPLYEPSGIMSGLTPGMLGERRRLPGGQMTYQDMLNPGRSY